jgi:LL-diaminopimelate aminotransferase
MPADPWFQTLFADRIGGANYGKGSEIYKFEKIKRAKRKALADRPDVRLLDFGIGENDDMAAEPVRRRQTFSGKSNLSSSLSTFPPHR